jgi:putative transposase
MIALVNEERAAGRGGSLQSLCQALSLSRATCYRSDGPVLPSAEEVALRDVLQQIALEMPCYGYRRLTHALQRRGYPVHHKRVLRLMRQDNLLCLRRPGFVVTTDGSHGLPVYPNLVPTLTVTGLNQLWVADLTYIRLQREFLYLALLLDAYSRRCIGWQLGRRLTEKLTRAALEMALATRRIQPGLVHHSDRGVQYASRDYTARLTGAGLVISMSRTGNPYDNACAESFIKTLKYEEVYLSEYESLEDALESIEHFLEAVYNRKRLHSSLGYVPPAEFEAQVAEEYVSVSP